MSKTAEQQAEFESVKRFVSSIVSEYILVDLPEIGKLHRENFEGFILGIEMHIVEQSGTDRAILIDPWMLIGNGLLLGWWLGREYEKRMQLERMFGCEEKASGTETQARGNEAEVN